MTERESWLPPSGGQVSDCAGGLTPKFTELVHKVPDALSGPAGAADGPADAWSSNIYTDTLQEAIRRLVAAGLLPERAGRPVGASVHTWLADLMLMEGSEELRAEWTSGPRDPVGPDTEPPRPRLAGMRGLAGRGRRRRDRLRRGGRPGGDGA